MTLYTRPGCSLCVEARAVILAVRGETPFPYREVDISDDPDLTERFGAEIPVVCVGGRILFKYRVDAGRLRRALRARGRT